MRLIYANDGHKYFFDKKFCDPASHRRAPALRLGPLPKLTLPTKLRAQWEESIVDKGLKIKNCVNKKPAQSGNFEIH